MPDYTNHQKKIIQRYYDNREQLDEQRLSELVTSLYLTEGKKLEKLWKSAEETLERLKIPASRILHLMQKRDPALLAEVVKELQAGMHKG